MLSLLIALLMFPQIAQTLYSPALADFSRTFSVAPAIASQALTVYFLAFALGVVVWGRVSDLMGRRPALGGGLVLYAAASAAALFVDTFYGLLVTQAFAAFGAAVGSVVTQTILRDRYSGEALAKVFATAGMVLAAGPAIGLFTGAAVVGHYGYKGAMLCLASLSLALLGWAAARLRETRPAMLASASLPATAGKMIRDAAIWRSALLVAVFNVALYSYYALGPFVFERLHLSVKAYGYSGFLLAAGSCAGAWLNRRLLRRGYAGRQLVAAMSILVLAGGIGLRFMQDTAYLLLPVLLIVLAFGVAIPNILGESLSAYKDRLGTAGALFGLLYYLMIGAGMLLVGWTQALAGSVLACGLVAVGASFAQCMEPRTRNIEPVP
ncbi:MFS transporter [Paraburkholderia oxyphila]|uniref:MFS transporter n=1 Tax=Paraburkholderia oxyphila TaxID=614212 RepID=UPI000AEE5134|nr:MFS transporter [Paraburkholderia oxyphila]